MVLTAGGLTALAITTNPVALADFNPNHDLGKVDNHTLVLSSRESRGTSSITPIRHIIGLPTPEVTPRPTPRAALAAADLTFSTTPDLYMTPADAPFSPLSSDYFTNPQDLCCQLKVNIINNGTSASAATFARVHILNRDNGLELFPPAQAVQALLPSTSRLGSSQWTTWKNVWPNPQPVGTNEITVCLDATPTESNTSNDCFTTSVIVSRANLETKNMTASITPVNSQTSQVKIEGDIINTGSETSNAGRAIAPIKSGNNYSLVFPAIIPGTNQFDSFYPNLNPGQSSHVSFSGNFSTSFLSSGITGMLCADADGSTTETNEDNCQTMTINQSRANTANTKN